MAQVAIDDDGSRALLSALFRGPVAFSAGGGVVFEAAVATEAAISPYGSGSLLRLWDLTFVAARRPVGRDAGGRLVASCG